ncbi:membrane protein [Dethiosulfatarculus sandiegensis]|uniref:Probable membrane transporter protein n=2 Tax=Dethiosulfatarculus sandiegensis TaxID=1429043 RepID=A0A0D2HL40_9BACT|nr:membrane protein [Dethiosulfatarculus sandiegensis]
MDTVASGEFAGLWQILLMYGAAGCVAGVLAGLFGVGGGVIVVPALTFVFTMQNMNQEVIMHMALGTSLAAIIMTSSSSVRAHHKRGAVKWPLVGRITPGIIIGVLLGSVLAAHLSSQFLKIFFACYLLLVAVQMFLNAKPKATRQLPGTLGVFGVGNIIGIVSSLVGIGGGTLSVPFMVWCNVKVHKAIATSAAIGMPIAIFGAIGYIINGWGDPNLPPYSLGYVQWPALLGVACVSVLTAPLGAKIAYLMPTAVLKKVFAIFLLLMAVRMFWSAF